MVYNTCRNQMYDKSSTKARWRWASPTWVLDSPWLGEKEARAQPTTWSLGHAGIWGLISFPSSICDWKSLLVCISCVQQVQRERQEMTKLVREGSVLLSRWWWQATDSPLAVSNWDSSGYCDHVGKLASWTVQCYQYFHALKLKKSYLSLCSTNRSSTSVVPQITTLYSISSQRKDEQWTTNVERIAKAHVVVYLVRSYRAFCSCSSEARLLNVKRTCVCV